MGNGKFDNRRLNFVVSADHVFTAAEEAAWKSALQTASDVLFTATDRQLQFGDIYLVDNNYGRLFAEVVLSNVHPLSGGTRGLFGTLGETVIFARNSRGIRNDLAHEMAHHLWDLGDEYARPMVTFQVDKSDVITNK